MMKIMKKMVHGVDIGYLLYVLDTIKKDAQSDLTEQDTSDEMPSQEETEIAEKKNEAEIKNIYVSDYSLMIESRHMVRFYSFQLIQKLDKHTLHNSTWVQSTLNLK